MCKEAPYIEPQEDAHATLRAIYQNPDVPIRMRMSAAIAAIGFEKPKLEALAVTRIDGDFGEMLERAVTRSNVARLEGPIRPIKVIDTNPSTVKSSEAAEVSSQKMGQGFPLRRRI
jgi:hypothetical protein